jgi:hypothetical protein
MSVTLQANSIKNYGFLNLLRQNKVPVSQYDSFFPSSFRQSDSKNIINRNFYTSSQISMGTTHDFYINNTEEYVDSVFLKLEFQSNVSGSVPSLVGLQCIDEVDYIASGDTILTRSPQSLFAEWFMVNNSNLNALAELLDILGGNTQNLTSGTLLCYVPIFLPGASPVDLGYNLDTLKDMQTETSFPVKYLPNGLNIRIKFKSATNTYVLDPPSNNNFASAPEMIWNQYSHVQVSSEQPNTKVDPLIRQGLYIQEGFFDQKSYGTYTAFTAGTSLQTNSLASIASQSAETVSICVMAVTDGNQTNKNLFIGSPISEMTLKVSNKEYYEHYTEKEARIYHVQNWGGKNNIPVDTIASYMYNIPLSWGPLSFGEIGTNLFNSNPILSIKVPTSDNYTIPIICFQKALYRFEQGKLFVDLILS